VRILISALILSLLPTALPAFEHVVIKTNLGDIRLELYNEKAPETVKNFLLYAEEGFYDGTVFHRVIKNFMIQGGGFDTSLKRKSTHSPIRNEAENGLKNDRGTIAMARTGEVNSATSQFFINLKDNDFLNFRRPNAQEYGYAVFGKVVEGMEVVDKIGNSKTVRRDSLFQDLPEEEVLIKSVERSQPEN